MANTKRSRIGLLGLMLELYKRWPDLEPSMRQFADELVSNLSSFAEIDFPGICNTREQVEQTVARFEADRKDLILVVLLTYAPSHIALPALARTRLPVVIFNTQRLDTVSRDTSSSEIIRNHGIHGVQDLANVLLRAGCGVHLVTGHYKDPKTIAEIKSWCDAARTVGFMHQLRIGLLGYPMEGMGDLAIDHTALLSQVGTEIHQLAMKLVAQRAKAAPREEIAKQMRDDRRNFQFQQDITTEEHEASSRLEWALRDILREKGLHGFASHFGAIGEEGDLMTLPFLAASKLLAEGYAFGGEGDVTSAAAVAMMQELAGEANFTEMFTMDFGDQAVLMMHMGESNWRMARSDEPIWLLRSTLDLFDVQFQPLLLAFSLKPGEATLVSLTTAWNGKLKLVVSEGEVLDFPYVADFCRPHFKFKPDKPLADFLNRFSMAGGSHHLAMAYGRWATTLEKFATLAGIEYACI